VYCSVVKVVAEMFSVLQTDQNFVELEVINH